ncbi:MAG: Gfo/Idh/MocA family protein [Solirubrobacterales bacterium]
MRRMNRREFVAAATAGTWAMAGGLPQSYANVTTSSPIKLGLIGCGWYGMVDVRAAFNVGGVQVAAVCDVDSDHLAGSADEIERLQGFRPQTFSRYKDLLEVAGLNAVIIATPPHWHALPFLAAAEKNLDIYCEKPLAYDIREARAMVDAVQNKTNVVQIGFQRRQSPVFRKVREYIQQGNLGRVVQAEAQIHYTAEMRDATPQNPPSTLDWDTWCGPAPKLPYSPQVGHFAWRLEKTTGHGHLVDWGIHLIDATRYILGETMPQSVQASGGLYYFKNQITTPDVLSVQFDFASCPVLWRHRIWGAQEYTPETSNGIFFYGDNGTLFVTDNRWVIIPKEKGQERIEQKIDADMGTAHMAEFLEAVRTRKPAGCSIEEGYRSTATVKLAMIAYDVGARIAWDETTEQIVNNPAAAALLMRPYRTPWKHPYQKKV